MPAATTVTAPSRRDPALDGLRGIAVLFIYIFHYGGGLQSSHLLIHLCGIITASGWIGVQMFFALSGFLITRILWASQRQPRARHRLRNFYARRVLRIFPMYYAALLTAAIIALAIGNSFHDLRAFASEVFFLQDLPRLSNAVETISKLPLYHLWSIAVEEQFYVLWPLLLLLCRTRRAALLLCLGTFVASFTFCIVVFGFPNLVSDPMAMSFDRFLLTNAGGLALGALIAIAWHNSSAASNRHSTIQRLALPAFVLGIAVIIAAGLHNHTFTLNTRFQYFTALPAAWIVSAALIPLILRPGLPRTFFSNALLCFLGRISYGFYVLHILLEPLFNLIDVHLTHTSSGYTFLIVRFLIAFPITLTVAWVSYQLFEFPFLKLKRFFPLRPAHPIP